MKPDPEFERAFLELCKKARSGLDRARNEVTDEALAGGAVPPIAICVALVMASINVAAMSIIAGEMKVEDWEGELRKAVEIKRAGIAERLRGKLQ